MKSDSASDYACETVSIALLQKLPGHSRRPCSSKSIVRALAASALALGTLSCANPKQPEELKLLEVRYGKSTLDISEMRLTPNEREFIRSAQGRKVRIVIYDKDSALQSIFKCTRPYGDEGRRDIHVYECIDKDVYARFSSQGLLDVYASYPLHSIARKSNINYDANFPTYALGFLNGLKAWNVICATDMNGKSKPSTDDIHDCLGGVIGA